MAQTAGLPIKAPLFDDGFGEGGEYLPGATALGDILQAQGYRQAFLLGSNAEFADKEIYFSEHGDYEIIDLEAMKEEGDLPGDYDVWWGCEDEKLFACAKETLTELAKSSEPFNFTMLTVDTHFPDGYVCRLCGNEYEEQYANVLACSSRQVDDFVRWVMSQPFYENTAIVISGDHLTMDPNFLSGLEEEYIRTTYNCFLNAAAVPEQETNRQFGSFDLFPTMLAALGVEIEGERLGLGTNLFSGEPTLTERYGFEHMDEELQKPSDFYDHFMLRLEE
ncbi:MAG: LTA synthase family protein [Clostridia bacterium]|nr:LTA synthase family protein [Clostridia bacterium]